MGPQPGHATPTCWTRTGATRTPPTRAGSSSDRGPQYRPIVFWMDDTQRTAAEASKAALGRSREVPAPMVTEIAKGGAFLPGGGLPPGLREEEPATTTSRTSMQLGPHEVLCQGVGEGRADGPRARLPRRSTAPGTSPADEQLKKTLNADAVRRDPEGRDRAAVRQRVLPQLSRKGSTSTSSPASRCSAPRTSSTPAPAGRASRGRLRRATSCCTGPHLRHGADRGEEPVRRAPTSATSSTTARRPRGCATAWTPRRCGSSRWRTCRRKGYGQYLKLFGK